jgi:hypothetical protein
MTDYVPRADVKIDWKSEISRALPRKAAETRSQALIPQLPEKDTDVRGTRKPAGHTPQPRVTPPLRSNLVFAAACISLAFASCKDPADFSSLLSASPLSDLRATRPEQHPSQSMSGQRRQSWQAQRVRSEETTDEQPWRSRMTVTTSGRKVERTLTTPRMTTPTSLARWTARPSLTNPNPLRDEESRPRRLREGKQRRNPNRHQRRTFDRLPFLQVRSQCH